MLLTIHNLPSSTRYVDVKNLLKDKCGLTDIIVDNLVSEGNSKKVTVGLSSDDDGAFVVRKLNGLFINGLQLYIEDRRRPMADQPYCPVGYGPASNNMQLATAPFPVWNQDASQSYIQQMPVDQNLLTYSSYGVASHAARFMEPQPVSVGAPGYTGYQADQPGYEVDAPNNLRRNQESGDWGTNIRDLTSNISRHKDRKRRHSPDRSAAVSKRSSRFDHFNKGENPREPFPQQQWPVENRVLQERKRECLNQNELAYQPQESLSDYRHTDPMLKQPRWVDPRPCERDEPWSNDDRDREPLPVKVWDNEPEQWRDEPTRRWDNQPKPQWESQPKLKWENPPKPQSNTEPVLRLDSQQKPQWNSPPKYQPNPQWEDHIPLENIRSEWYDHLASSDTSRGNNQDFQPQDRHRYNDSRSRDKGYSDPISEPSWNREPERTGSSGRQARPIKELKGRPRSRNGRQGRDDWRDKAATFRDRYGRRQNSDYGKPKEYASTEFKRQGRPERDAPKAVQSRDKSKHEYDKVCKQNANRNCFVQEKITYPPESERPNKKPVDARYETNKPKTLRCMINKDVSNRGQATALLAKKIFGGEQVKPNHPTSPQDAFTFKQLKGCIKSRIDLLLGEELSVHMLDVVKRYRSMYPISDDKSLMIQIREKSIKEFEALPPKLPKEKALKDEASNVIEMKKEKSNDPLQSEADDKPVDNKNGSTSNKEQLAKKPAEPPVPPSVARMKRGQPLTDKQVIQQMKLLRKWEYDQDDLYSLDEVTTRALDDEMAELDNIFIEECSNPVDQHETLICKHITTKSLNNFNKTIGLYITKRFLNIQNGLTVRMFASGKPPKKKAVLQYLKKHKIVASAVKKSVKGAMFVINVTKFEDFDLLCNMENDVIDDIPVSFKAMHLIGPPLKMNKNQIKSMRQRMIDKQIKGLDLGELEEVDFGSEGSEADIGGDDATTEAVATTRSTNVAEKDFAIDKFPELEEFSKDIEVTEDCSKVYPEEVNMDSINDDDLEDF